MAILINGRFSRFIWYGPDLLLANANWAARINFARHVRDDKTSFISYKPGRTINSYGTSGRPVKAGDIVELDALGIVATDASTHFTIDNGTPAAAAIPATSGTWEIDVPAGSGSAPFEEKYILNTVGLAFGAATFKNSQNNVVTGSCLLRLDGGAALTAADFNAAVAALAGSPAGVAEIKAGQHDFSLVCSITSNVAGTLSLLVN